MDFYRRKAIYSLLIILAAAAVSTAQAQTHSLSSSTATTTPLVITRSLHVGESGNDVLALQTFLKNLGYFTYPQTTGYYGSYTWRAVAAFQWDNGLASVGYVGPLTRALVAKLTGTSTAPSTASTGSAPPSNQTSPTTPSVPISIPAIPGGYTPGFGGGGGVTEYAAPDFTGTPSDITAEATSPSGAVVTYATPAATDAVDGAVAVSCSPAPGGTFELGSTTVTCSATNSHGKTAQTNFIVAVEDTTAPSIDVTAPTDGGTVSGTSVALIASSSDAVGVVGVQFRINGTDFGTEVTSAPYQTTWDSTGVADGTYRIAAVARDAAGNHATSSAVTVTVDNTSPVISDISSGTPGQSSASITWITNEPATSEVLYGPTASYGSATTSASLELSHLLHLTGLAAGTTYHYAIVSADGQGNTSTTSDQTLTTANAPDTTPPTVSITAPTVSSTVSGTSVTLTATSSDNVGVAGVQFEVDGSDVGASGTTSPYSVTWDSTGVADGSHTVYAVAHDAAGNYATSSISITVRNSSPVISSIATSSVTQSSVTITWNTDEAATSQVNFGTTTSYGNASSSAALITSHSITLTGLTAGSTYYFQVETVDAEGNTATSTDQTFNTALYYDFTVGALPSGITFTRSSSATYYNSSGTITTAGPNVPRFDYNPSTLALRGLLYESTTTNVQNYSVLVTNGEQWQCIDCTIGVNAATAPDGSSNAATIKDDTTNTAHELYDTATNITAGSTVAVSAYIKQGTGTNNRWMFFVPSTPGRADGYYIIVDMQDLTCSDQYTSGDGTYSSCSVQSITNGWLRVCVIGVVSASLESVHSSFLTSYSESSSGAGDGTQNFLIWGVQKEVASSCSSYVATPSNSPVTRSADALSFTIPSGIGHLTYTFDNNSTQTVSVSPGSYIIPTNLNRPWIKSIVGNP